jgi:hypothetical protein
LGVENAINAFFKNELYRVVLTLVGLYFLIRYVRWGLWIGLAILVGMGLAAPGLSGRLARFIRAISGTSSVPSIDLLYTPQQEGEK